MAIRIIWFKPRCTSHILPLNLRKPLKSYSVCLIALFERNGTPSDYWHSCGLHFVKILSLNIYNKIKPETTNLKVEILVRHGTSLHAGFFFFTDTPCKIRKKKSDAHKLSCFNYLFPWNSIPLRSFIQPLVYYVQMWRNLIGSGPVKWSSAFKTVYMYSLFPYNSGG